MFIRILVLIAIAATMFNYEFAPETLATVVGFFAFLYYWLLLNVVSGLKTMTYMWEDRQMMHEATTSAATHTFATVVLILITPYAYVGYIAIPWCFITLSSVIFGWLLHFEILEINTVNDENNEKDDD